MNCQELLGMLLDYVGGEMVIELRTTVEVHVAGCKTCGVLVHSYSHTVRVARVLPRCAVPADVEARLRARLEPELNRDQPAE